MRRGTKAAELFGQLLYKLRTDKDFSMYHVASKMGVYAAYVSQCEKGQRAVKEPKLEDWARALEVDMSFLRERWLNFQLEHPDGPIYRKRSKSSTRSELAVLLDQLSGPERERVIGYMHRLVEERSVDT